MRSCLRRVTVVCGMLAIVALVADPRLAWTATPARVYATVPAAKDACVSWTYAENKNGIYSAPEVTFKNACVRPVMAYICVSTSFSPSSQACAPKGGSYWSRLLAAQSTFKMSTSSGGRQVVVIRECPAGYERPATGIVSDFPCEKT